MKSTTNQLLKLILFLILFGLINQPALAQKTKKDKTAKKAYNAASKAFRKKDYTLAVSKGTTALLGSLKKKQKAKALKIVGESYMTFYGNAITEINNLKEEHESYHGLQTVYAYNRIMTLYRSFISVVANVKELDEETITSASIDKTTLINYGPEIKINRKKYQDAEGKYVSNEYAQGLLRMDEKNKRSYYKAFIRLSNAHHFQPDFRDVKSKRDLAKEEAIYYVKVLPLVNSIENGGYEGLDVATTKSIKNYLTGNRNQYSAFVKLIDAQNADKIPDIIVSGSLSSLRVTTGDVDLDVENIEKEIVIREEKVKKSDGSEEKVKIKQNVRAVLRKYSQTKWSTLKGFLKVDNQYAGTALIQGEIISSPERDDIYWTRLSEGDIRALSSSEKRAIKEKKPTLESSTSLSFKAASSLGRMMGSKVVTSMGGLFRLSVAESFLQNTQRQN